MIIGRKHWLSQQTTLLLIRIHECWFWGQLWYIPDWLSTLLPKISSQNSSWIMKCLRDGRKSRFSRFWLINFGQIFPLVTLITFWSSIQSKILVDLIRCLKCTCRGRRFYGKVTTWCCGSREHLEWFWTKLKRNLITNSILKVCVWNKQKRFLFLSVFLDTLT